MDFRFSDDQRAFQSTVRDVLANVCPPAAVRAAWATSDGAVDGLWPALVELGVIGMLRDEAHGGLGLTFSDLVLVLEEIGRAAAPGPVLEAAAVVAPAVPDAGDAVVSAAFASEPFAAAATGADGVLFVDGDAGVWCTRGEFATAPVPSADGGRPFAEARARPGAGRDVVTAGAFDRAALGAAAQLLGLADAMVAMAAAYACEREQFGRPIGGFQAVKHHLANAYLRLQFARPVVYRAAHSLSTTDVADQRTAERDVSMAKSFASEAATAAARVALQVHGAIGYTWEHDLHLWMKPAWALASMYGDARWHRRRVARQLGLPVR